MNFTEAFETLARLYESVSPKNPFLAKALSLYSKDTAAKGVIVSIRKDGSGTKEEEVGKLYHSTAEFDKIMAEIYKVHGTDINVSAIHDRDMIKTYEIELEKIAKESAQDGENQAAEVQKEQPVKPQTTAKYTPAQLTAMRQNNNKIISATKVAGLDISNLVTTGTDKNGRQYKKASPELNKLRKTLFGESKKD